MNKMIISNINDILERPFKQFTIEEQYEIIKQGRFTDLTNLCQNDKGKFRTFSTIWYKRIKWLTGNTVNRRLYCWYCVLFPTGPNRIWNYHGFDDLKNMSQSIKKHEESKEHIYSSIKLKLMMKTKRNENNEHKIQIVDNVKVKRNRKYLERLIDIASALLHFEVPFRQTNDEGFYKYLLNVLKKYDDVISAQMEEGSQFKGVTKTIQIDLINCIAQAVKQKIIDEVNAADFFAIQVQEINNSRMCRQIGLSVRYVKDAKLFERFFGLYEVPFNKKVEEVFPILEKELENLNFKEKLVAQSYDGGVVQCTELYNLQQSIKKLQNNMKCLLVHCYGYELSTILSQSLHCFQDCKLFFSVIDLFSNFFRNIALIDVLPNVPSTWTNSVYSCIKTILEHSVSLIQVLEFINSAGEYQNSSKVLYDSVNLISHLNSFKFMLFVHIFQTIFSVVEESMNVLRKKTYDAVSCRKEVNTLIDKLKHMKSAIVFRALLSSVPSASAQQVIVTGMLDLYTQILDSIIYDIDGRFLDIEQTEFCSLVSLDKIPDKSEIKKLLDSGCFQAVKENYSSVIDAAKLKSELDLLYSDPSIIGIGDDIAVTRISDVMKFMYDHEINNYLPALYKLMTLVVTISSLAEPVDGEDSVFSRIKEYSKTERNEDPKGAFALLAMEKELFYGLEKSQKWYDQIITFFSNLPSTSSIELQYKYVEIEDVQEGPKKFEISDSELDIKTELELC